MTGAASKLEFVGRYSNPGGNEARASYVLFAVFLPNLLSSPNMFGVEGNASQNVLLSNCKLRTAPKKKWHTNRYIPEKKRGVGGVRNRTGFGLTD